MKLVLFEAAGLDAGPGLLTERGVVSARDTVGAAESPQGAMQRLIDGFEHLRARLDGLAREGEALGLDAVTLLAPLPRPGKIVCSTSGYGPPSGTERVPLLMTLKSAESVIGPGGTIVLPDVDDEWLFVPQAELGLVIRGPARRVKAADWRTVVFGYTCVVDVMARGDAQFGRDFWLAKSDTLGPLGPCIVTADEVPDPSVLRVKSWQNGQPGQDFLIADAEYDLAYQVEFATTVMTLHTGDLLTCGSQATAGKPPLAHGDTLDVEIEQLGRLSLQVKAMAGSRA